MNITVVSELNTGWSCMCVYVLSSSGPPGVIIAPLESGIKYISFNSFRIPRDFRK